MGAYVVRRLLLVVPILFLVTVAGFIGLEIAPGDPMFSQISDEMLQELSEEQLGQRRSDLGLEGPVWERYGRWVGGMLQGDFGYSVVTGRPVLEEISARAGPTLILMGTALAIAILIGVPFGIISAVKQYSLLDYGVTSFSLFMISTPSFVLGVVAIYVFGVWLDLLPVSGMVTLGQESNIWDRLAHLTMPAMVLGLHSSAQIMRYTRNSMLDVLTSDYMVTARSKGLSGTAILLRHGLRNALIPVITIFGLLVGQFVAGAVVTEQVFGWPGMGRLAVSAAQDQDPALLMAIMVIVAVGVLMASLLADISYALVDPRVRYERS